MRQPVSWFLLSLFCALIFLAGCNPPATTTCSPYIGQATINEVSKVQQNSDSAGDFVEIRILTSSLTAATLNNWKILVCERGTTTCGGAQLSSATVTGTGANRYYVLKSQNNIGRYISFTNTATTGTEVALADQNDAVVDYLSVGNYLGHEPTSCTFPYDTDADTASSTRRVQRIPDGTGSWDVVSSGNSTPPTEGASNDGTTTVAHLSLVPSTTSAVTCDPITVTLTPHNASHGTVSTYTGTVSLTSTVAATSGGSSVAGTWELVTGTGSFTGSTSGTASYRFASGETSAVFRYKNTIAGTVTFTASDGAVSASENSTVAFSSAGFIFLVNSTSGINVPTQISGKDSNSGWNSRTLSIRAVTTDPATGVCVSRLSAGSQSVDFAYDCTNPANCSASPAFRITGNSATVSIPANASTPTAWSPVSLLFDSNGTAPFVMNFSDAGQVQLHVKKDLAATATAPAVTVSGYTPVTFRPFGIRFENNAANKNADETGTTNAGKFVAAGSVFTMNLTAFAFGANEDANGDGVPDSTANVSDNAVTANFAAPVALTVPSFTPATGTKGTLGVTTPSFSAGTISLSNQTYSEVGSAVVNAAVSSYLSLPAADFASALTKDSPKLGRFFPYDFYLGNVLLAAPSCTSFTYMSQPFSARFSLVARNAQGVTTANYSTALGYANTVAPSLVAENSDDGLGWDNRGTIAAGAWSAGTYRLDPTTPYTYVGTISFDRSSATVDGPYSGLQLGMRVIDKDGAKLSALDVDMLHSASGSCTTTSTCTAKSMGSPAQYRYGRLALRDTTGSDRATAIVIPASIEYFNGTQWVRNEADSCTDYGNTQINDVNFSGALAGSYTDARAMTAGRWWLPAPDVKVKNGLFLNYPNALSVTPVAGLTGKLGVTLSYVAPGTFPAWLTYDWDAAPATPETGPSCTVTLGQYRGHDRVILWRERN
jgi:MSHA biogenesis protein MshQ